MFDPANHSEQFKRFLEVFFGEFTFDMMHDGIDTSPLYRLSAQERSLAEDLMIEHLKKGKVDSRLVTGLGELRSRRAIPLIIKYLQRTDLGLNRIDAAIQLRRFPCQQVVQALVEALSDNEKLIRHHAANSLLIIYEVPRPPERDLALWRADPSVKVMSEDPEIREAAVAKIRALGKEKVLPSCSELPVDDQL